MRRIHERLKDAVAVAPRARVSEVEKFRLRGKVGRKKRDERATAHFAAHGPSKSDRQEKAFFDALQFDVTETKIVSRR
jgi:hypothetical protein